MQLKAESDCYRGYIGASYQSGSMLEECSLVYLDQRCDDKNVFTPTPLRTTSNSKTDTVASLAVFIRRPWTSGSSAEWISVCVRVFALEF